MAIQIDPDTGPVETRGHLLDMGRLAGAVIALDHHSAIVREPRRNRERGIGIEYIAFVAIRNPLISLAESGYFYIRIDFEKLAHFNHLVRPGP